MTYVHTNEEQATRYNSQLDVIRANNKLASSGQFPDFLARTEQLVHKFGVMGLFGVRLLHKHNDIGSDEIMVEFEGHRATRMGALVPVLETLCIKASGIEGPSIFVFARDGTPLPMEYSIQTSAAGTRGVLEKHRDFIRSFAREVYEYGLQDVIGLCVPNSEFCTKYMRSESSILVERSDHARRANVIFVGDRGDVDLSNVIQTTWTFTNTGIGCGAVCEEQDGGGHKKVDHIPDDD
jgi:hypothetical protein